MSYQKLGEKTLQCLYCHSLFFKTLEIRISGVSDLLYKKRCKRCKHKQFFRKNMLTGAFSPLSLTDWLAGRKINLQGYRASVMVSEYTRKISKSAERQADYLRRIQQAQESGA